jgi:hypothetical protein
MDHASFILQIDGIQLSCGPSMHACAEFPLHALRKKCNIPGVVSPLPFSHFTFCP